MSKRIAEIYRLPDSVPEQQSEELADAFQHIQAQADKVAKSAENNPSVKAYWDCLNEWSKSAGIEQLLPRFKEVTKLSDLEAIDIALLFQNGYFGCASALYRDAQGGVSILHTEEDDSNAVEKPLMTTMTVGRVGEQQTKVTYFQYPMLLPGSTFGWREQADETMVQTVNYLPISQSEQPAHPVNLAVWNQFLFGDYETAEQLIEATGPFVGGYSVQLARLTNGENPRTDAKSVTFVHNQVQVEELANQPGSHLERVNSVAIRDKQLEEAEESNEVERMAWKSRADRLGRFISLAASGGHELNLAEMQQMLSSTEGSKPLAREDVLAGFVARLGPEGFNHRVIPATPVQELHIFSLAGQKAGLRKIRPTDLLDLTRMMQIEQSEGMRTFIVQDPSLITQTTDELAQWIYDLNHSPETQFFAVTASKNEYQTDTPGEYGEVEGWLRIDGGTSYAGGRSEERGRYQRIMGKLPDSDPSPVELTYIKRPGAPARLISSAVMNACYLIAQQDAELKLRSTSPNEQNIQIPRRKVMAFVKENNPASARVLQAAGFEKVAEKVKWDEQDEHADCDMYLLNWEKFHQELETNRKIQEKEQLMNFFGFAPGADGVMPTVDTSSLAPSFDVEN